MIRKAAYFLLLVSGLLGSQKLFAATPTQEHHFDMVVYGSTASGVMTAVSAARSGLHVALVDPGHHIGGMVAGGLSHTDQGNEKSIGGLAREFFERVGRHYNKPIEYDFEPHVAEQVLNDMLQEAHVAIFLNTRLLENGGVTKKDARITSIKMENGSVFSAAEFVDSSYEGDLMASAMISNTWGREAANQYNESKAGVLPSQRDTHQFTVKVSAYAADGSLLPSMSTAPKGSLGQADKKIPAYNFRMCFSGDKSNQVAYPKPDGYDPHQYDLLARLLAARTKAGEEIHMTDMVMRNALQGGKFDINNWGAFSTDDINASWEYPTASYKRRAEIIKEHYRYQAGYFYFLAHDPRVPSALQKEINQYGLAKDEFTDTGNWPWQFYVREARRMVGAYVMTQHDILETITKPDSIGMGSYQMDSHNVQRVVTAEGTAENEGDMFVWTPTPYEIPYRSIVPKSTEAVNLFVTACFSASHAAYGTLRTEPVYMIVGQAAGDAAAIAIQKHLNVQAVPVSELQSQLITEHAVLHLPTLSSK